MIIDAAVWTLIRTQVRWSVTNYLINTNYLIINKPQVYTGLGYTYAILILYASLLLQAWWTVEDNYFHTQW